MVDKPDRILENKEYLGDGLFLQTNKNKTDISIEDTACNQLENYCSIISSSIYHIFFGWLFVGFPLLLIIFTYMNRINQRIAELANELHVCKQQIVQYQLHNETIVDN